MYLFIIIDSPTDLIPLLETCAQMMSTILVLIGSPNVQKHERRINLEIN
jgi:hypothetical protein